jgi:uncharacterized caspase-like protein
VSSNALHYGVVVGINRYPELRRLERARGDAERFAEWLRDPAGGGLPHANVRAVVVDDAKIPDGTPRKDALPTRNEVLHALFDFRKAVEHHVRDNPDDWEKTRLYFYVSGHGIAPTAGEAALLMANAGPEWYGENLACGRLLDFLGESQSFREVVVFADCCREWVPDAPLGDVSWTRSRRDNGKVTTAFGCATFFGDIALEPAALGVHAPDDLRGYFTQALLEGLRGQGVSAAGTIDTNGLAQYVRPRVKDLTKGRRYPQIPTMDADPAEPIVFRQAPSAPVLHRVRFVFVTPFAGDAELRDGNLNLIARHTVPGADWTVQLANGLYEVAAANGTGAFRANGIFRVLGQDVDVEL